jgi:hypothetical protein
MINGEDLDNLVFVRINNAEISETNLPDKRDFFVDQRPRFRKQSQLLSIVPKA